MRSPHDYRAVMLRTAVEAATTVRATSHLAEDARSPGGPYWVPPQIGFECLVRGSVLSGRSGRVPDVGRSARGEAVRAAREMSEVEP
jgi:hypothetical protein